MTGKPTLCLDLDGCIHLYSRGWADGSLYDQMVPGFPAWAMHASQHFELVVYSSRSSSAAGIAAMQQWMRDQLRERMMPNEIDAFMDLFTFASEKPPAWLTIDDRAITFKGDWSANEVSPGKLLAFKPWNAPSRPLPI